MFRYKSLLLFKLNSHNNICRMNTLYFNISKLITNLNNYCKRYSLKNFYTLLCIIFFILSLQNNKIILMCELLSPHLKNFCFSKSYIKIILICFCIHESIKFFIYTYLYEKQFITFHIYIFFHKYVYISLCHIINVFTYKSLIDGWLGDKWVSNWLIKPNGHISNTLSEILLNFSLPLLAVFTVIQ